MFILHLPSSKDRQNEETEIKKLENEEIKKIDKAVLGLLFPPPHLVFIRFSALDTAKQELFEKLEPPQDQKNRGTEN